MSEKIVLIDSNLRNGRLLGTLIQRRIGDVQVHAFSRLGEVPAVIEVEAVVLNDWAPAIGGGISVSDRRIIERITEQRRSLFVVCSSALSDPVVDSSIQAVVGPGRIERVDKATLTWADTVLRRLEEYILGKWLIENWYGLFAGRSVPPTGRSNDPSTQLALIKSHLETLEYRPPLVSKETVRERFIVSQEGTSRRDVYSLL